MAPDVDYVRSFVRQHYRPITLVAVAVILCWALWMLRGVLAPFVLGLLLAWLLQPAVDAAERRLPGAASHPRLKRILIILGMYLAVAAVVALFAFYVIIVMGKSVLTLALNAPQLVPAGLAAIEESLDAFLQSLPPSTQAQVSAFLAQVGTQGGKALADFISGGIVRIRSSSDMILGFVALPVFLFYLLKDWHELRADFYRVLPAWALVHVRNTLAIVRNVIGRYLKAQVTLGIAVGFGVYVLLTVFRVGYALPLAVFAGVAEFVPFIGPWLSGIVGILVVLATVPDKFAWVALGYILIQIVENHVLAPKIQGQQMMIHPAIVIVLTMLAGSIAGLLGFLIVLPVTLTVIQVVKYAQRFSRKSRQVESVSA